MHIVERRIFAGCVLEIQRYLTEGVRGSGTGLNPRFKDPAERQEFMLSRSKRKLTRLINENFTPAGYYCTFTCDDEHECHTVKEIKKLRDLFTRRIKRKYKDAKIVSVIGKGKNTDRYHVHMIAEGVPEEELQKQWRYGDVRRINHLREHNYNAAGVDCGRDYTGLAEYMIAHWDPEQGKRKWKATKNLKQPEIEIIKEPADRETRHTCQDSKVPEAPEGYILVEARATKYGLNEFKFVLDPRPKKRKGRPPKEKEEKKRKQKRQRKKT